MKWRMSSQSNIGAFSHKACEIIPHSRAGCPGAICRCSTSLRACNGFPRKNPVMKIHDRSGFPNPARIRIVLAEKGLEAQVEFVTVDLIAAEHKQAAFLARNPQGVLPVPELDDGIFITESTAITEYLDNLDGHPTLTGTTPRQKAMIHMMQRRAEAELLDAVGIYFHYATPGLGPLLQVHKSPEWEGRTAYGERHRDKALAGMRYFDEILKAQPYVA